MDRSSGLLLRPGEVFLCKLAKGRYCEGMKKHVSIVLSLFLMLLGAGPSAGDILLSYESGIATSDLTGAADPESQGWSFDGTGGAFADGFDAGTGIGSDFGGGWRTVDGTGGAPAIYLQDTTPIIAALTAAPSWKMTWTIALDLDAVRIDGGEVEGYYGAPNQARQNALLLYFDMDDVNSFRVVHRVNELNEILLDVSGTQYNTGVVLDAFGTYSITYDAASETAKLDYGAGIVTISPSIADPDRSTIFMGSGSTGGQGSAVWNSMVVETTEVNPATEPSVVVTPGTDESSSRVLMTGEVTDAGNENPVVTLYYGATDGGIDPGSWDDFVDLGRKGGVFSRVLDSLNNNTTVFYRAFAENSAGNVWSPTTESVTSRQAMTPAIAVLAGTSEEAGQANFKGMVTDNGNDDPEVTIFYGTTDEGTNAGAWESSVFVGFSGGDFSQSVLDLLGGATYFYRAFSENSVGASWSPTTESVTTQAFAGVPNALVSEGFDFLYEMDENPSNQDLDLAGIGDWYAAPAQATGVDQEMFIPQTYENGIASSNQAAGLPEALFRSDYGGSVSREALSGDFTVEVALQLKAGTIATPGFDLGGFGMFINPPDQTAFRLNINEDEVSSGMGDEIISTASNTAGMTVFRIAYVEEEQRFWVWRNGVLLYGNTVDQGGGVDGSEPSFYRGGGFLLGDFAADLSGDWDVDYIRLHNEAVAPSDVPFGSVTVTQISFVNASTVSLDFQGSPNTAYQVQSSEALDGFPNTEAPTNGTSGLTSAEGIGRVEIDVTGRANGKLFFRVESP